MWTDQVRAPDVVYDLRNLLVQFHIVGDEFFLPKIYRAGYRLQTHLLPFLLHNGSQLVANLHRSMHR